MKNKILISGFKCFRNNSFELNDLTVLSGNNGTGKSTVIQALLLIRLAIEKNSRLSLALKGFDSTNWENNSIPLNDGYELSLGTVYDIFNEADETSSITMKLDNDVFEMPLPVDETEDTSIKVRLVTSDISKQLPFWRRKEFYYLHAERLGPRHRLAINHTDFAHCGNKGEFTAQVLLKKSFHKVKGARLFKGSKSEYLSLQVDSWLDYICPGTSVKVDPLGSLSAQIKLRNNSVKNHVLASNIGFGISYSLPIIVNGLIAEKGSVFIVENPEAHLHPKGQSNIGYFLGKVAASGVKVVIETHSEHVVNGIRRAALSTKEFGPDLINIYFFNEFSDNREDIFPIDVLPAGDLSRFPRDFFDQVQQDMSQMFFMQKNIKK